MANIRRNQNSNLPNPIQIINLGQPTVTLSKYYIKELNKVPSLVQNATNMFNNLDINSLNEDDITNLRKNLRHIKHLDNNIQNGLKRNRRWWNNLRDRTQQAFLDKMKYYKLDQLSALSQKATRVNRAILNNRANKRWAQLKSTFDAAIQNYPHLRQYAPQLVDFSRFRIMNPKLVSRAKSKPITDKHRAFINNAVAQWNSNLNLIISNPFKLTPQSQNRILQQYVQSPNDFRGNAITTKMKDQKDYEVRQAKLAQQRQDRILKQQKQQKLQAKNKKNQKPVNTRPKVQKTSNPYGWLVDYIQSSPTFKNIHNNAATQDNLIFRIMQPKNMSTQSFFGRHIRKDPVYLKNLMLYILNL